MLTKEEAEKALAGAPVETEDGREVTQLTKFRLYDGQEVIVGAVAGRSGVSQWETYGFPRASVSSPLRLKKEKRTVEYTLMVKLDGETIWVESNKAETWNVFSKWWWHKTNQTMTKEIEVE